MQILSGVRQWEMRSALAPGVSLIGRSSQSWTSKEDLGCGVWSRHVDRSSGRFPNEDLNINRVLPLASCLVASLFVVYSILSSVVPSLVLKYLVHPSRIPLVPFLALPPPSSQPRNKIELLNQAQVGRLIRDHIPPPHRFTARQCRLLFFSSSPPCVSTNHLHRSRPPLSHTHKLSPS